MILITGADGQLGTELCARIPDAIAVDKHGLDVTDRMAVYNFVSAKEETRALCYHFARMTVVFK